ncbi:MAG: hypothetical protein A2008_10045 [Candidatus Wallbacteria bacterium GWC2_49_35]|uniref:Uncharacterized protein n=1 Tax=Candidatus Wallbacteria bacterium GWC2_49_35 TaxID=1817813 RepID=A0A1F7WLD6_9BACT|nr:MAG: hypothetical protein A2008_10045 [Candidatus Wallbacteria bacterium GWC2_49_35]HBC76139.1 hypothetical protein [Candidatus Wallbacteria bacterium]
MNDKQELNPFLTALLVLIFVLVLVFTYILMFGRHSYHHENKPFEGFTYIKKTEKDGKVEQSVFTTASAPPSVTPGPATHSTVEVPKDGYLYNHFETIAVVLPKNKFSHIAAVRNSHFTWDDSPYYKAHTASLGPMARSGFDTFVEEKLMTKLDDIDFNHEMLSLMRQAQNNTSIKNAADMIKNGRYDEALTLLRTTVQTTDNICVRSLALSHIVNVYRLTGDNVQEKRAWGSLAVVNTQYYLKMFPDKANALKSVSAIAKGAIGRFETDKPNLNFKLPNKDF